ncbi:MAG: MFS transporter, partial [Acutalibacteraceae bacterium]
IRSLIYERGNEAMNKSELLQKVKGVPAYVKEHWDKPNEGEYLSLKEVTAYTAAQAGSYIFMTASGIMTFSASYFCGAIMGLAAMDFSIINLIGTIIGYILIFMNPIGILIYENHGQLTPKMRVFAHCSYIGQLLLGTICYFIPSHPFEFIMKGLPQIIGNILVVGGITNYINWFIRKKFCAKYGRLKPFILICGVPCAIIMSVIPYLPLEGLSYTNKLVILHFAFTLMNYFLNSFVGINGLVTFMTPNSQERQRLHSIVPIITGLFPSIISMFFPILIISTGGYLNIKTYKVFVPIFAFLGVIVTFAAAFCKERIIEPPMEKRKKVTFWKGAKNVLKNKYLWITNISNIFSQWQWLVGSLLAWWFIYSLRMEWFSGIAANIVVVGMTAGNLLCPVLTKRFQKRDILISFRALTLLTVLGIALAVKLQNIYIFMISMFLRNTVSPIVDGVGVGLSADILNYHQWKYGERADAMSGVFGWFLNPITMGIGLIVPWALKSVGFTSDWDVLYDSQILNNVFSIYTWVTVIGLVLVTIPFFFYDLTKEKHEMCVRELQARLKAIEEKESGEAESEGAQAVAASEV